MGAWGTGIFQNDTANDIRDEYRDHIGNGLSGPEATARVLKNYASSLADPDEAGVVWLALAATQWLCGRLEPEALEKALAVIDSGSDLERWKSASNADYLKRRAALEKLRVQLTSPQPEPKKIRRRALAECDWQEGEIISYRLLSGKLILMRMIGLHNDKGGRSPYFELLDWSGDAVPPEDQFRSAPVRTGKGRFGNPVSRLLVVGTKTKFKDRLERLEMKLPPEQTKVIPAAVLAWKDLDAKLAEWFDFR
ncbi:MAG TPA: DUF4259 domain-containing protein [Terracidiphilus sp.]|nr:DUF4259 domain-containing protein [Terracidiphilus sp.]